MKYKYGVRVGLLSQEATRIRARIAVLQRRLMRIESISPGICDRADRMRICKTPTARQDGGVHLEALIMITMLAGIWMLIIGGVGMWWSKVKYDAAPSVFVTGQTLFFFSWMAVVALEFGTRRNP